ncbi:TetR/AcrR family transcriptional regulator [Romboutsia weinsteinii]|uniref:TetR/AcrR family transcriptional regulator n=1 Tax=Romboutsia weinsteinii TaxID=2020949 RepID=A0A371J1H7_9FIRM|nr:TetR/AcrR family transcriptional regulator [Romboutsia weinsteinii]RDY26516.1 TetR/AcrR family transcriptional regulator [Romboutsia weinsteinii]
MKNKVYSNKEILIFEGFIKLIDSGANINNIRVSDIAVSAGIGKGTVYEYFKSKEEIIAKSLLYNMQIEIDSIVDDIKNYNTFEEKCFTIFQNLMDGMNKKFPFFQVLLTSKEFQQIFNCLNDGVQEIIDCRMYILSTMREVLDLGVKEKIINVQDDKEYEEAVILSVTMGLSNTNNGACKVMSIEEMDRKKDFAYRMLVKSLN